MNSCQCIVNKVSGIPGLSGQVTEWTDVAVWDKSERTLNAIIRTFASVLDLMGSF